MLLFTLAGCWIGGAAILGGSLNNDFVVDSDTGWEQPACAWVMDYTPATREVVDAAGVEIQVQIDGDFDGTGSIIGVETELEELNDVVTIRPTESLLANTTYTWWLDTGCQYVESTFTTSPYGGELTLTQEELGALSYDFVMLSQSTMVVPSTQDSSLEDLLRGWIWGRGQMDAEGTLTLGQVANGAQDTCASTQQLQGFFNYPEPQVSWTGRHISLATDLGALDMEELRIDATIAPDGSSLGHVALSGLIGASQLSAYYELDYCESVASAGVRCVGCEDPQGCVRVRIEDASGRQKDGGVEAIEEDFCHALCEENSEECELE